MFAFVLLDRLNGKSIEQNEGEHLNVKSRDQRLHPLARPLALAPAEKDISGIIWRQWALEDLASPIGKSRRRRTDVGEPEKAACAADVPNAG